MSASLCWERSADTIFLGIDKTSSSELSEAINSMYLWYSNATVCYVFLSDFESCPDFDRQRAQIALEPLEHDPHSVYWMEDGKSTFKEDRLDGIALNNCMRHQLRCCRWFSRGWTLQELLAPREQIFFDKSWELIAHKSHILRTLELITGIGLNALKGEKPSESSVAQRMSWASKRKTTRIEDEAYCLLGVFGVSLPLIYGEGSRAFLRLQEEIAKTSLDQSIFAWELRPGVDKDDTFHCLFAPSVANFWWHASRVESTPRWSDPLRELHFTNQGVEMQLYLDEWRQNYGWRVSIAWLECGVHANASPSFSRIGLRLRNTKSDLTLLQSPLRERIHTQVEVELVSTIEEPRATYRRLALLYNRNIDPPRMLSIFREERFHCLRTRNRRISRFPTASIEFKFPEGIQDIKKWRVTAAHPRSQWSESQQAMTMPICSTPTFGAILIETSDKDKSTILFSIGYDLSNAIDEGASKNISCRYWMYNTVPAA